MTANQIKFRALAIAGLALAPVVFLAGVGSYHLYQTGWSFIAYWPMALAWLAAYGLGWWTMRQFRRIPAGISTEPYHWTGRDKAAWELVEAAAAAAPAPPSNQLGDLSRYARQAEELALTVARVYKPNAADPFGHLTLPEILTCAELVAHDLEQIVEKFVPGSHLLNLADIRRVQQTAQHATDWYPRLRNAYWLASAVVNPIKVGLQVAMTRGAMVPASKEFQKNVLLWFQTIYLKQLGRHLIELNSGRLKVGAGRYRELQAQHQVPEVVPEPDEAATDETPEPAPPAAADAAPTVLPVTVAIVGPVKAGKSSLVNAFLGEQRAATDVLPLTAGRIRYQLRRPGLPLITLIDTLGFGNAGPTDDDVAVAVAAAQEADLMLMVVPARSAAREPEVEFLTRVQGTIAATPELNMPPLVLVLSHIDLLTPAMEWTPPYKWQTGSRPKEVSIREAVAAAREHFPGTGVVPVCTVPGREVGVRDDLAVAVMAKLGEARGVSLLRSLAAEAGVDSARKLFRQITTAGAEAARVLWAAYRKS